MSFVMLDYRRTLGSRGNGVIYSLKGINKNNKNSQLYFQEAFGFTLFAVILSPRASSLSSTYCKQCRRACSAS